MGAPPKEASPGDFKYPIIISGPKKVYGENFSQIGSAVIDEQTNIARILYILL